MKVIKAEYAGACYGVKRALDLAFKANDEGAGAFTLGPLIHNPKVVAQLADRGIVEADDVEDITPGATVVIRSHGVTPAVMRATAARTDKIIDATCPHVARAQKAAGEMAEAYGLVVVVGEAGHPEVEGLVARAREKGAKVVVVSGPDELPCDLYAPLGLVVQTTQKRETFDAVVARLRERGLDPDVHDTICFATRQRQDAAAQLAHQVDAIVVIGGRNSSNTTRLASICRAACPRTHHIEGAEEIDSAWFDGCATVGVTAGASTPEDQIEAVVSYLERL